MTACQADTLTILRARGRRLAKHVARTGEITGYDSARTFDAAELRVRNLQHLASVLERLLHRPDCCVVRGSLVAGARAEGIRRLLHPDVETGEPPSLRETPRSWLAVDLEGVERPACLPADDLAGCAREGLQRLPTAFLGSACIVTATGSHGIKPGIRLRLWFWLSRPTSGSELKRWLRGTPADPSVFGAAQVIYTAAPVFEGGADHLATRLAVLSGQATVEVPPSEVLAPPPRPTASPPPRTPHGCSEYVRKALIRAADAVMHADQRHPTLVREGCGLARFVQAGVLPERDMRQVLTRAAEQAGKDDPDEITKCLDWALAHPSSGAIPDTVQHGR